MLPKLLKCIELAGCIILDKQGKVLLMHRYTSPSPQWEIPGGKIKKGESLIETACREVEEEIGVRVTILRAIGMHTYYQDDYIRNYNWFIALIEEGTPMIVEQEHFDDLCYFDWYEIRQMIDKSANVNNLVNAYFAGELDIFYDENLAQRKSGVVDEEH